jgi:hypothetical protein
MLYLPRCSQYITCQTRHSMLNNSRIGTVSRRGRVTSTLEWILAATGSR